MISLLAVILGAVIALAASLLAELIRTRRERAAVLTKLRYDAYLGFVLATVRANDALHAISVGDQDGNTSVPEAMRDSGLYPARERLLVTGSPEMVLASEAAFRTLLDIRDAVAQGMPLAWPDYRPAADGMAKGVWALRLAARREFDGRPLDLEQLSAVQSAGIAERLLPLPDPGP
ncbi:hypothetical protein [Streptomyces sp. HUAS ZL42]|uniref:hypothetical protein n=1 Tax=Streptomyces sp. HUAS ZL42 TaxID=3231715 RepID=UPI00345E6AA7